MSARLSFKRGLLGVVALVVSGSAAWAQAGETATKDGRILPVEHSSFLGRWELDLTRMPATYGTPPKRVVYAFDDVGGGKWSTTVDITAQDGGVRHMVARYFRDGQAVPSEGDTSEADSIAMMSPSPNVLVMNIASNKRLGSVRVYTVSADGTEMTEAAAGMTGEGMPFIRNFHYRRVR